MKINIRHIKPDYSFTGWVSWSELTPNQRKALHLQEDNVVPLYVPIEGLYEVHWDDDIPQVEITAIDLIGASNGITYRGYVGMERIREPGVSIDVIKPIYGNVPAHYTIELRLDIDVSNLESLEDQIEDSGLDHEWSVDRISSAIDNAYDMVRDG